MTRPELEPDALNTAEMTIFEHLEEVRARLIRSLIALAIGFLISFAFAEQIFQFLSKPLIRALPDTKKQMVFTSLPEVFFVYIKVALFTGILLALPVIFYQIWKFVAPALYRNEKRYVLPFVFLSTVFFIAGTSFGYFEIFPWGFKFFIGFSSQDIQPMITLKDYLKFATRLLLAFGLIFEMPIIITFLARIGLVTPGMLNRNRKYAVLIIVILAAILTPPDVITQLMMAAPMWILYEISIISAWVVQKRRKSGVPDQKTGEKSSIPRSTDA